jgi:hypothetical protein
MCCLLLEKQPTGVVQYIAQDSGFVALEKKIDNSSHFLMPLSKSIGLVDYFIRAFFPHSRFLKLQTSN